MWPERADVGSKSKACLTPPDWCFSTKPLSLPLGYAARNKSYWSRSAWRLEHNQSDDAARQNDFADGVRRSHDDRDVSGLSGAVFVSSSAVTSSLSTIAGPTPIPAFETLSKRLEQRLGIYIQSSYVALKREPLWASTEQSARSCRASVLKNAQACGLCFPYDRDPL
jgi:hypothetical protein